LELSHVYHFAITSEFGSRLQSAGGGLIMFLLEIVFLLCSSLSVLFHASTRNDVEYLYSTPRKLLETNKYGGVRQYIPLKVNAAGVMPIIFAQAIMFIPAAVTGFSGNYSVVCLLSDMAFWYNLTFATLIICLYVLSTRPSWLIQTNWQMT
jgi:preprotein translocase subunit SecY